jgi:hypothetical protein
MIEPDVEPIVNLLVERVILVANCLRGCVFLQRFCFGCCAVLVRAADVNNVVTAIAAEPDELVLAQNEEIGKSKKSQRNITAGMCAKSTLDSERMLPCIDVATQHAANNVAQVRHIINVGQSACDEDISSSFLR